MPSLAILVSAVLVLSCGQTDRQTDRITEADQRYTHATAVDASKDYDTTFIIKLKRYAPRIQTVTLCS